MRDALFIAAMIGLLPVSLLRPWIGILAWNWISDMNPNQLTWNSAERPWALFVALMAIVGFLLSRDRKPFLWTRETVLIVLFWLWTTMTTVTALYPTQAYEGWERFSKILLMALLAVPLFQERGRLRLLLLVIAVSIGFYGLKGGIWALLTGGQQMVYGPPGNTFISDNTSIALGLVMCIPLLLGLARDAPRPWLRRALYAMFFFSIIAVPFTYSRGGFIALVVVLLLLFLRTRAKLLVLPVALAGILLFLFFAPDKWIQRIQTTWNYEKSGSAQARLRSWRVGYLLATDHPVLGGGFWAIANRETYLLYDPEYSGGDGSHDSHSIYFNVLGEHGFVGFGIFIALIGSVLTTLHRLQQAHKPGTQFAWIAHYAQMLQVSVIGYLIAGTFLSYAYFDVPYQLFVVTAILKHLCSQREVPSPSPGHLSTMPRLARLGPR